MATVTDPRDIILAPVISEKSYGLIDDNVYTFPGAPRLEQDADQDRVEKIFSVKVAAVNTANRQGKRKRTRSGYGQRKSTKRAMRDVGARQQADRIVRRTCVAEDRET